MEDSFGAAAGRRILIVEDEGIVAKDIEAKLTRLGYAVAGIARSGVEAVRLAEESDPDLVLMDINLNGGPDGIQTAAQIQKRTSVPLVYLTAFADDRTMARARATKPFAYLFKPFEEREVRSAIEIAFARQRAELQTRAACYAAVAEVRHRALAGVDLSELMAVAADMVSRTLNVEYSAVWQCTEGVGVLSLRAGSGWRDGSVGQATSTRDEHSLAGYTLMCGQPVSVEFLPDDRRFHPLALFRDHRIVSGVNAVIC